MPKNKMRNATTMRLFFYSLFLLLLFAAGCSGTGRDQGQAVTIDLIARDIAFDQQTITVLEGQQLNLSLTNEGQLLHDFNLLQDERQIEAGDSHAGHASESGIHLSVAPRQQIEVSFAAPPPGRYPYYCSVEGHADAGMVGELIVLP